MTKFARDDTVITRDGNPIAAAYNPKEAKAIAGALQFAHDAIAAIGYCRQVFMPMLECLDEVERDAENRADTEKIIDQFAAIMDKLQ